MELEALPIDGQELVALVEDVMSALEKYSARPRTPGGAGWLHVQHVPARRFVSQVLRKLLALSAWGPFAAAPGPVDVAPYEGHVGIRSSSSREYRAYTVTWSGIAYLLGAAAPHNPSRTVQLRTLPPADVATTEPSLFPPELPQSGVVALSWSSRHAATLLPVLTELAREGYTSVLVDLATDSEQRCPPDRNERIRLCPAPAGLLHLSGTADELQLPDDGHVVEIGEHTVRLARLVRLLSVLLETSVGCTQPSWRSVVRTEAWLDGVLATVRPHTVLVSNDTSPLGALAVHAAERHGMNTVHVQHGAWTEESASWPALHSRDLVVMGERDVPLARAWARHPKAEVHVLGQPRFDTLGSLDHEVQRRYLEKLLAPGTRHGPARIAVWACQPFRPDRLHKQVGLLLDGLRMAGGNWGLVIAPHPAQSDGLFAPLLQGAGSLPVAVADPRVGARGCLAGADAVVSVYSTCGIEAALLGVPVLEIGSPGERTLDLAGHGLAQRCSSAHEVATVLATLHDRPRPRPPVQAADAVCRWRGDSAARVARLISHRAENHDVPFDHNHRDARSTDSVPTQGEGVPTR
ncbi:hypothetical protein ACFWOL_16630 [Streptomyces sp. NPDC058442]|uniref:hypothetical protein n=1 Tax=Streptomyces sp. NPDC058442 TaxID=3346503 RepID=UPI003666E567